MTDDAPSDVEHRRLARNSAAAIIGTVGAMAIGVGQAVVTARLLGAEGKGEVFLMSVTATTVALVAGMSLGPALQVLVAEARLGPRAATRFALVLAAGAALLGIAFIAVAGGTGDDRELRQLGAALVPAELLSITLAPLFVTTDTVTRRSIYDMAGGVLAVALTLALATGADGRTTGAAAAVVAGRWVTAVAFVGHLWRRAGATPVGPWRRQALRLGAHQHGATLLARITKRADALLIGALLDARAVGVYSVAASLAELPMVVARSVHPAIISFTVGRGPKSAGRDVALFNRMLIGAMALALPVFAVIVAVGITPVFGEQFDGAIWPFVILLLPTIGLSAYLVLGGYFVGAGRPGQLTRVMALPVVLNLIGSVALIPTFELVGNAAASAVGAAGVLLLSVTAFDRLTGCRPRDVLVPSRGDWARVMASRRTWSAQVAQEEAAPPDR